MPCTTGYCARALIAGNRLSEHIHAGAEQASLDAIRIRTKVTCATRKYHHRMEQPTVTHLVQR